MIMAILALSHLIRVKYLKPPSRLKTRSSSVTWWSFNYSVPSWNILLVQHLQATLPSQTLLQCPGPHPHWRLQPTAQYPQSVSCKDVPPSYPKKKQPNNTSLDKSSPKSHVKYISGWIINAAYSNLPQTTTNIPSHLMKRGCLPRCERILNCRLFKRSLVQRFATALSETHSGYCVNNTNNWDGRYHCRVKEPRPADNNIPKNPH